MEKLLNRCHGKSLHSLSLPIPMRKSGDQWRWAVVARALSGLRRGGGPGVLVMVLFFHISSSQSLFESLSLLFMAPLQIWAWRLKGLAICKGMARLGSCGNDGGLALSPRQRTHSLRVVPELGAHIWEYDLGIVFIKITFKN